MYVRESLRKGEGNRSTSSFADCCRFYMEHNERIGQTLYNSPSVTTHESVRRVPVADDEQHDNGSNTIYMLMIKFIW